MKDEFSGFFGKFFPGCPAVDGKLTIKVIQMPLIDSGEENISPFCETLQRTISHGQFRIAKLFFGENAQLPQTIASRTGTLRSVERKKPGFHLR